MAKSTPAKLTETEELELELELAKARVSHSQKKAKWRDVIGQGVLKGASWSIDQLINAPENLYKLSQMEDASAENMPSIEPTPNRLTNAFTESGLIKKDIGQTTPAQEVVGAGAEGAGAAVFSGGLGGGLRQSALNVGSAAGGAATGKAVEQATGSPAAGFAASIAAPTAAGRLPSAKRKQLEIDNQVRNQTLKEADSVGFVTVPDNKLTRFADRPTLIDQATKVNQSIANRIARDELRLPEKAPLTVGTLHQYREREYQTGYQPILNMGKITVDGDYYQDLINIEDIFKGPNSSFPDAVPPAVNNLIETYLHKVPGYNMDGRDIKVAMQNLRFDASKNIASGDPEKRAVGMAQKAIAVAMEERLVRHANAMGIDPKIIERFQIARQNIAKSHVIQEALIDSMGNVSLERLGKAYESGDYLSGKLETAAKFGSLQVNKDELFKHKAGRSDDRYFVHGMVGAGAAVAATRFGLDPSYSMAIGALGWAAGGKLKDAAAYPIGKMFGTGRGAVDPSTAGLQSGMAGPAAMGYFESIDKEQ